MKTTTTALILAGLLGLPLTAVSAPVTVFVEGVTAEYSDPDGLLPFAMPAAGSSWSLTFTYDPTDAFEPGGFGSDPTVGLYLISFIGFLNGSPPDMSLTIDGSVFADRGSDIVLISNDSVVPDTGATLDQWLATSSNPADFQVVGGNAAERIEQNIAEGFGFLVNSRDPAGGPLDLLDSDALNPPPTSGWQTGLIFDSVTLETRTFDAMTGQLISTERQILASASATITNISVVPLPAALWLFMGGLVSLVVRARRKVFPGQT
jgi:hypothetical protein